jgi:inhibitor of cysteine peptidase
MQIIQFRRQEMNNYNLIKKATLISLMLLITLILSGCMFSGKTLTEGNNGQNLNLRVNEEVMIKLESNITTGFKWNLSSETDTGIVSFISSEYKQASTDKKLVGAGSYETFTFKAKSKGSTAIILTYNKPWEDGIAPLKTFKINIVVE